MQKIGIIFVCKWSNVPIITEYLYKLYYSITQKSDQEKQISDMDSEWKVKQTIKNTHFYIN